MLWKFFFFSFFLPFLFGLWGFLFSLFFSVCEVSLVSQCPLAAGSASLARAAADPNPSIVDCYPWSMECSPASQPPDHQRRAHHLGCHRPTVSLGLALDFSIISDLRSDSQTGLLFDTRCVPLSLLWLESAFPNSQLQCKSCSAFHERRSLSCCCWSLAGAPALQISASQQAVIVVEVEVVEGDVEGVEDKCEPAGRHTTIARLTSTVAAWHLPMFAWGHLPPFSAWGHLPGFFGQCLVADDPSQEYALLMGKREYQSIAKKNIKASQRM